MGGWRHMVVVVGLVATLVLATIGLGVDAASLPECVTDSQNPLPIIKSFPCGTHGVVVTRRAAVSQVETDVTVQYMVHTPTGVPRPKALVVLFAGGLGGPVFPIDPATGQMTNSNNFLVRSAQLFAERGYRTVTIDRPSDHPPEALPDPEELVASDQYRISARHAQDIVTVIASINQANLDVFLAGTSRGALSVVAQWMLGIGSMLSSPVIAGLAPALYIGAPGVPNLQPAFVGVPVHVMAHAMDACTVTSPAGSSALHQQFIAAGISSEFDLLSGGFDQSGDPQVGPCGARAYHGFLGIENAAVNEITTRMDTILQSLAARFPGNRRPVARFARMAASVRAPAVINLMRLTDDPDHDRLTFFLPYTTSSRGAAIELRGPVAMYHPVQGGITDGFVYVVSDLRGGMSAGVVVVDVAPGFPR